MKLKKIKSCNWYHQTTEWSAKSILSNGFVIESGGNQRLTEGVYLLNHPEGLFGDVTLKVCVDGNFLDFSDDEFGNKWTNFKRRYWKGNYTKLTEDIKRDFPNADGVLTETVLIVWYPKNIKKVELIKGGENIKLNYCSKCGRRLIVDKGSGVKFCSVHIDDMNPVSWKHPKAKEFRKLPKNGD